MHWATHAVVHRKLPANPVGMGAGPAFEATPSWRLSIILGIIVAVSYLVENTLHKLQHRLSGHDTVTGVRNAGRIAAVGKLKDELMLLGFISMILAFTQDYIATICMPSSWMDPKYDISVAANHVSDPQCSATMYHKGGYGSTYGHASTNATNGSNSTDNRHRRLAFASVAEQTVAWGVDNQVPADIQAYLNSLQGHAVAALSARRQLGGGGGGVDTEKCIGLHLEEFISVAALHQAHILLFIVALAHIVYSVLTMNVVLAEVSKLDQIEVFGDEEGENAEILKPPTAGWAAAFYRSLFSTPLSNPFTYMSLRNFFIIKHADEPGVTPSFPFDDYIYLNATADFKGIVGMKWWMWLLLTITVTCDGLDAMHTGLIWTMLPVLISLAVGTKVKKIEADIALASYALYDKNKDGRLSQDEIAEMQKMGSTIKRTSTTNTDEQVNDKNFWCGKPSLLTPMIQYIIFQNSMVFSMAIFNFWQVDGQCYTTMGVRITKLAMGLIILAHDAYVTLPTYSLVIQMGDNFNEDILKLTVKLINDKEIESSHVDQLVYGTGSAPPPSTSPRP